MVPGSRLFGALFLLLFSICLSYSILTTDQPLGGAAPRINVRWAANVTPEERAALETRHQLAAPVLLEEDDYAATWSYSVLDTSSARLRALIQDPRVADTHRLDRIRFEIAPEAKTGSPLPGFVLTAALIALAISWLSAWFGRSWRTGLGAFVTRGIPAVSPQVLGFFRVFYAAFLFIALIRRRLDLADALRDDHHAFEWGWVDWLASRPDLIRMLENGILVLLVVFALGLFARVTYALIASGLTVWTVVMLLPSSVNIHVWELAFLTTLCLLPVPWGAAFSLDETIRRWRGVSSARAGSGQRYGFALWLPGFLLGAVWLGAAYTKVQHGFGWILGGSVKYHWVIDADQAAVDWGLWIASHHGVAVFMSFMGVALEATFILAAFARTTRMRIVLATLIGGPLLIGFHLFHGVLWWTWGLVFLSFVLPWHAIFDAVSNLAPRVSCVVDLCNAKDRRRMRVWHGLDWLDAISFVDVKDPAAVRALGRDRAWILDLAPSIPLLWPTLIVAWPLSKLRAIPPRSRRAVAERSTVATDAASADTLHDTRGLQVVHACIVCVVCLLMVTELPKGFGRFTSYSNSYASTADFDARHPMPPVDHLWINYGTPNAVRISGDEGPVVDAMARLRREEALRSTERDAVGQLDSALARTYGEAGHVVTAVRTARSFDWQHGRFVDGADEVLGTLDLRRAAVAP